MTRIVISEDLPALLERMAATTPLVPLRVSWFAYPTSDAPAAWRNAVDELVARAEAWATRLHAAIFQIRVETHLFDGNGPVAEATVLAVQMPSHEDATSLEAVFSGARRSAPRVLVSRAGEGSPLWVPTLKKGS